MIDFDEMVSNHLKREFRPREVGRYYPSDIGGCLRKTFYRYKFPQEIDPALAKIFEMGNLMHEFVVDVLKSEKNPDIELLKSEFPFKEQIDDFLISGRIDNLILVKSANKSILVEVKSTKNIEYITGPSPSNIVQVQLYMHYLGVHDGILLYIDKRDLRTRIFDVKYSEREALAVIEKFKRLHTHLKENNIPSPEARMIEQTLWMCRFCEYSDRCYKETPKSKEWL